MADLTDGYWLSQQIDMPEFIISFSSSGQSFCYVCATSDDGGYDAYYDSSLTSFYKYAVDVANGRLCFMPDQWFDILILNENILSLCADDGTMLRFTKVNADSVNVVSPEQFRQLHPDAR